jgi:threonylcarbamoyladenosine tRNA methylthiotransferase MtaB
MRRPYDSARFSEIVKRVRSRVPDIAIGTDVMVGFPGEEDSDFDDTLRVIAETRPSYLHRFTFSARPGTPASRMKSGISSAHLSRRLRRLKEVSSRLAYRYRKAFVGKRLCCVVEEDRRGKGYTAVSGNYLKISLVNSPANPWLEGALAEVEVLGTDGEEIQGRAVADRAAGGPVNRQAAVLPETPPDAGLPGR